jgi:hypothetical protein
VHTAYTWYFEVVYFYPHFMAVVFLIFLLLAKFPAKGRFFLRTLISLIIATTLAHVNRWFYLWPADPFFVSGHMTFSFGVALSLGAIRRWTFAITLPLLVPFGAALVILGFHTVLDVVGAIPLVLVVYGTVDWLWPLRASSPPLDIVVDSPYR